MALPFQGDLAGGPPGEMSHRTNKRIVLAARSWFRFIGSRNLTALSAQAAITKYHKRWEGVGAGGLKQQTISHSSGRWEVQDQSAGKLGSW